MLSRFLPSFLVGAISLFLHTINTLFWAVPIFIIALVKFILPISLMTKICNVLLNFFASSWVTVNFTIHKITKDIQWDISIPENLSTKEWYLIIANHQSWVDILTLQQVFNGKTPFLKFFLKQELFWVPVLGLAWWALDFPFMKRFSKSYIKKNPHKKGKDFETTRKACEKFKSIPISIMNFAEGTRFTQAKNDRQNSPYQYLLKPKSGGIGYVLTLMGNEIKKVVNVTITYPESTEFGFWSFLCGKVRKIKVQAELIEIPNEIKGDYIKDPENRKKVQQWINHLWQQKDNLLSSDQIK